jgi:hypothetical protein
MFVNCYCDRITSHRCGRERERREREGEREEERRDDNREKERSAVE